MTEETMTEQANGAESAEAETPEAEAGGETAALGEWLEVAHLERRPTYADDEVLARGTICMEVDLDDEELLEIGRRAADERGELDAVEAQKKAANETFNERIKEHDKEVGRLSAIMRAGTMERSVDYVDYVLWPLHVERRRADTWELIGQRRALTAAEYDRMSAKRQIEMPFAREEPAPGYDLEAEHDLPAEEWEPGPIQEIPSDQTPTPPPLTPGEWPGSLHRAKDRIPSLAFITRQDAEAAIYDGNNTFIGDDRTWARYCLPSGAFVFVPYESAEAPAERWPRGARGPEGEPLLWPGDHRFARKAEPTRTSLQEVTAEDCARAVYDGVCEITQGEAYRWRIEDGRYPRFIFMPCVDFAAEAIERHHEVAGDGRLVDTNHEEEGEEPAGEVIARQAEAEFVELDEEAPEAPSVSDQLKAMGYRHEQGGAAEGLDRRRIIAETAHGDYEVGHLSALEAVTFIAELNDGAAQLTAYLRARGELGFDEEPAPDEPRLVPGSCWWSDEREPAALAYCRLTSAAAAREAPFDGELVVDGRPWRRWVALGGGFYFLPVEG